VKDLAEPPLQTFAVSVETAAVNACNKMKAIDAKEIFRNRSRGMITGTA
jgi:hypothetical protein